MSTDDPTYRPPGPFQEALDLCVQRGQIDRWTCKSFGVTDRYMLYRGPLSVSATMFKPHLDTPDPYLDEFITQGLLPCLEAL